MIDEFQLHWFQVNFNYCPSIYGCRAPVYYLDEDLMRRVFVDGNLFRVTFTLPEELNVWVVS